MKLNILCGADGEKHTILPLSMSHTVTATMSMPSTTTFIIPTKVQDNCSYSAPSIRQVIGQEQEQEEKEESKSKLDSFQYYSSDLLRLKTLLLNSDREDDELDSLAAVNNALRNAGLSDISANSVSKDASKRRRGNNSQPIEQEEPRTPPRKTRLSWELHPSMILHDLYDQAGEDVQSVSGDEDNHEE